MQHIYKHPLFRGAIAGGYLEPDKRYRVPLLEQKPFVSLQYHCAIIYTPESIFKEYEANIDLLTRVSFPHIYYDFIAYDELLAVNKIWKKEEICFGYMFNKMSFNEKNLVMEKIDQFGKLLKI